MNPYTDLMPRGWIGIITKEVRDESSGLTLRVGDCVTFQCCKYPASVIVSHNNQLAIAPNDSIKWHPTMDEVLSKGFAELAHRASLN